jgi:hypothetical protein
VVSFFGISLFFFEVTSDFGGTRRCGCPSDVPCWRRSTSQGSSHTYHLCVVAFAFAQFLDFQ